MEYQVTNIYFVPLNILILCNYYVVVENYQYNLIMFKARQNLTHHDCKSAAEFKR